jgi:hypothetical protein
MEADELLLNENIQTISTEDIHNKKERLYQLIGTGNTKKYLGKQLTVEEVQSFTPEEINDYCARYQSSFGAKMAKSIGKSLISMYTKTINYFFKVKDIDFLSEDLTNDPIVSNTIGSISCALYYRFGNLLGPVAVALISANHIDFSSNKNGEERRNSSERDIAEESGESD